MSIVGMNSLLNQYVPTFYLKDLVDGQTLQYDSVKKAFINVDGGGSGGTISIPLNQIVYGTGPSVSSSPNLTYIVSNNSLQVNSTNGVSSVSNPNSTVSIMTATNSSNTGNALLGMTSPGTTGASSVILSAGSATVPGALFLGAGSSTSGSGANVQLISGSGNAGGGAINITAGNGDTTNTANTVGTSVGGILNLTAGNGDFGGSINITAGNTAGILNDPTYGDYPGNLGGSIVLTAGIGSPGGSITLTSGAGYHPNEPTGAITIVTADQIAGPTGTISISSGQITGGGAPTGNVLITTGLNSGGPTGSVFITTANSPNVQAGNITIKSGDSDNGTAGDLILGAGNSLDGSHTGNVSIYAGNNPNGNAGSITITSGTSSNSNSGGISIVSGSTQNSSAGPINITTGSTQNGNAGNLTFTTGSVTSSGNGGSISFISGNSGPNNGLGGNITFNTGSSLSQQSGNFTVNTAPSGGTSSTGNIMLTSGYVTGTGSAGNISITAGSSNWTDTTAGSPGKIIISSGNSSTTNTSGSTPDVSIVVGYNTFNSTGPGNISGNFIVSTGNTEQLRILPNGEWQINSVLPTPGNVLTAVDGAAPVWAAPTGSALTGNPFIMSTFQNADMTLHLAVSTDGKSWNWLIRDAFTPSTGAVRDPTMAYINGAWWVAFTNPPINNPYAGSTTSIGLVTSTDLVNWTQFPNIDVTAITGVQFVWAPEWFIDDDGSIHLIFCASSNGDHVNGFNIYEIHPTTGTNVSGSWTSPVQITGSGFPSSLLDPTIVKISGTYYLWFKNNLAQMLGYATSTSLTSGYTTVQDGSTNWAGFGFPIEGPSLVKTDSGNWRIYFDKYTDQGWFWSESADTFATWTTPVVSVPPGDSPALNQGTVIRLTSQPQYVSVMNVFLGKSCAGPTGLPVNAQTGSSYKLQLQDAPASTGYYGVVTIFNSGANQIIIPSIASANFRVGTQFLIIPTGTGQTTIVGDGGTVTLLTSSSYTPRTQFSNIMITKVNPDTWILGGDLT